MNKKLWYLAGVWVVIVYWVNPVLTKFFLEEYWIDTLVTNFLRLLIWWIIIFISAKVMLRSMRNKWVKTEKFLFEKKFFIALWWYMAYHLLSYTSLRYTSATNVELINAFTPVWLVIIALFLSPMIIARFRRNARLVFIIVLFGAVWSSLILNVWSGSHTFWSLQTLWVWLAFLAMLWYALFSLKISEYKENKNLLSVQVLYRLLLISAVAILPFALFTWFNSILLLSFNQTLLLVSFLAISWWLSALLWMIAARNLNVLSFILLHNFTPLVTIWLEMYLLGFELSWRILVWGLLIIWASISIEYLTNKQEKEEKILD